MSEMQRILFSACASLICLALGILFLHTRKSGRHRTSMVCKGLSSLCFVLIGLIMALHNPLPGCWAAFAGLVFGMIGDLTLALRMIHNSRYHLFFILGGVVFALQHLVYIITLLVLGQSDFFSALPLFAMMMLFSMAYSTLQGIRHTKMQLLSMIYIALVAMVAALGFVSMLERPCVGTLVFTAGAALFWISDNFLCVYSLGRRNNPAVNVAVHVTYLIAQLLIAWSILYLK